MGDRWMDERDRQWRERDWRRSETYGRGEDRDREGRQFEEDRSWTGPADEHREPYRELTRRRPRYGGPEADYGGRSSVTTGGGYGFGASDDDDYARSYRADRDRDERVWRTAGGGYDREPGRGYAEDVRRSAGGYGYDRGYGAPGRPEQFGPAMRDERREGGGDFLQRAGERIGSWFRGDHLMHGSRDEGDYEPHRRGDTGPWAMGHRGRGPKGYQRSDERIGEEVHDRLTEDHWLDASHIEVEVKNAEVTLSGHVENREAKHRAERLVEDLPGVRHVQNNLRVNPDVGFTGAGRGFGSSALEAEMRRNEHTASPGRTGAEAERSTGLGTEGSVDPKTGARRN